MLSSVVEELVVTVCPVVELYPLTLGPTLNKLLHQYPSLAPALAHLPAATLPSGPQFRHIHEAIQRHDKMATQGWVLLES